MTYLIAIFWASVAVVVYTYVGYPLAVAIAARFRPARPPGVSSPNDQPVSVVLAVFNEESRIAGRICELARLVAARPAGGEVIVVSDGSTDGTIAMAGSAAAHFEATSNRCVPVLILSQGTRLGKAMALNRAREAASHPLLIFADARQSWADDALERLTEPLADPAVGAVSGDLVVESSPGVLAGVGLYWKFEKWLRRTESRFDSMISVTGCISAVRRELCVTLPAGTILDDVYWPLSVAMRGYRVVHQEQARAFDRLPDRARDEFRRKIRTLAGNFQLMALLPAALLPWRNRLWWQFVSHRFLRLLVPWALLLAVMTSAATPGLFYRIALSVQLLAYLVGLAGCLPTIAARSRAASGLASFLILNVAAWIAFWVWISGRATRSWGKVRYDSMSPSTMHLQAGLHHEALASD